MRQQSHQHSCGAVALCNAAEAVGVRITEDEAINLVGADPVEGTQPSGIKKALKKLDLTASIVKTKDPALAYWTLVGALEHGNPAILLVDQDEHWVSAIGILGSRVVIADSADAGTVVITEYGRLMQRWSCPEYFAIVIGTKN